MKRLTALILCLCLLLAGCLDYNENPPDPTRQATPSASPSPTPVVAQDGGTLRVSMRTPLTLNPLLNEDVTVDRVLKLIFEPLTVLDDALKPTSHIASLNFSSDYTSVTLTLRDDVIWSDGIPVSSDDVIFTVDFLRNAPETAIYKHSIDNIATCEKLDAKSVKISFLEVFGGSGYLFDFPVIPQHYYKNEKNPSSEKNMTPLGNGLFLFEAYQPMKSMQLAQSPYTFRKRAHIEKVEAVVIPDMETELYAFDQGLIDVIVFEITEWSKHHSVKQTRYGEFPAMYYEFIGFNFKNPVLGNKLFRQALAHAMDLDEWVSATYLSHAARTLTPVNPASWVYDPAVTAYTYDEETAHLLIERVRRGETYTEAAAPEDIAGDESGANPDDGENNGVDSVAGVDQNDGRSEAGNNENAAGTDANHDENADDEHPEDNPEEPAGDIEIPPFNILVNEENDERVKIAQRLVECMNGLGLEATLDILPFDEFAERLAEGEFDLFIGGYNLSVIPDLRFAFHTSGIYSGSNLLSYSHPALDRMLNAAFSAPTENAYLSALSNIQQHIADELPVISLGFRKSAVLTDTRVYGDIKPSVDNVFANINEWFIIESEE